jgi:hypothetical protein
VLLRRGALCVSPAANAYVLRVRRRLLCQRSLRFMPRGCVQAAAGAFAQAKPRLVRAGGMCRVRLCGCFASAAIYGWLAAWRAGARKRGV